jgi:ATP-binding cassette, subfamily B, bacterial
MVFKTLIFFVTPQATALLSREFINTVLGEGALGLELPFLGVLIAAVTVVEVSFVIVDLPVAFTLRFAFQSLVRKNMFDYILRQPGARALPASSGEAISRFRGDVDTLADFTETLPFRLSFLLYSLFALIVMFRINWMFTVVVILPMLLIIIFVQLFKKRMTRLREASRQATGEVMGLIGEIYNSVQAIKMATAEEQIFARFEKLNARRLQAIVKESVLGSVVNALFLNTSSIGTGLLLIVAAAAMRDGTFSYGDLSLFLVYIGYIAGISNTLGSTFMQYRQVGVAMGRIRELIPNSEPGYATKPARINLRAAPPAEPHSPKTAAHRFERLDVSRLCSTYPGTVNGIIDVSFGVKRSELIVITGRIGSGKTTLLRTILGLLPRTSGTLSWNNLDVTNPGEFMLPPRTAYTPQVPLLFSESLRDNILLGIPENVVDLEEILSMAVMDRDLAALRDGLDTMVGTKGVRLSGGQVQRTAAARMFARDAEVIFLDDLSSALDVETEQLLWDSVRGLRDRKETTCIAVSHRRPAFLAADRILLMVDGRLEAEGGLADLLETSSEMRRLWEGDWDRT